VYNAKLLREILDSQVDMVCRFRSDGTILFVNRAYADTLGRTPEDLTGASLWAFVTGDDRAGVEEALGQLTPAMPDITIENRIETPEGARWTLWRNRGLRWDEAGNLVEAQSTGFDISERKRLEEQRQLLIDELNHRVRNTLMVVQGMAHQTFRGDDVPVVQLAAFNARLHALAGAHTALSRANWTGADVGEVIDRSLAICGDDINRVARAGPSVSLRPNAAVALALVLHELATNAVKYGALAVFTGKVSLRWEMLDGDRLMLLWQERDGPAVEPPSSKGFGSRLITKSVTRQLDGQVELSFDREGLTCRMSFPLQAARLAGGPG